MSEFVLPLRPRRAFRPDFISIVSDLLPLWDVLTLAGGGYGSARIYEVLAPAAHVPPNFLDNAGVISLIFGLIGAMVLRGGRLGADGSLNSVAGVLRWVALRLCVAVGMLIAVGFFARVFDFIPRLWVLMWMAAAFATAVAGRVMLIKPVRALQARGILRERVAIVGSGSVVDRLLTHLRGAPGNPIEIVGIFNDGPAMQSSYPAGYPASYPVGSGGGIDQLIKLGKQHALDRVVLTLQGDSEERIAEIVCQLKALDVEVALCPPIIELGGARTALGTVGTVPVMVLAHRPIRRWGLVLKAVEDRVLGAFLIALFAPVLLLIAAAVRLDSPGPVIFRQRRHGWNNSEFEVFKFRTMTHASSAPRDVLQQTRRNDSRITRVGHFLRRSSLDELPQLFNVLRGEMSLVGPRPHPVVMRTEQRLGHEIIAEYSHRHRVKPGMTGWAQINGYRGATETAEHVRKRVEHDIYYVDNWSIFFDLRILLLTPFKLLFDRENAF